MIITTEYHALNNTIDNNDNIHADNNDDHIHADHTIMLIIILIIMLIIITTEYLTSPPLASPLLTSKAPTDTTDRFCQDSAIGA